MSVASTIIDRLVDSDEPSIRFLVRTRVLGERENSPSMLSLADEIRKSARVRALLDSRDKAGRIPGGVYAKWFGAHWILLTLAELAYSRGDRARIPIREQVLECWLNPGHLKNVKFVEGRARRCGSQEGNALWALLRLGLDDERAEQLADNLLKWQWPDGGWNCDKRPDACKSSFHETIWPLRALALYAKKRSDSRAQEAAVRAAEIFLKRRLYKRETDGSVISTRFTTIHYPSYWHYDILAGLKVMAEAGFIKDPRCRDALDLLQSKQLPDGGFAAEDRWYNTNARTLVRHTSNYSPASWGPHGKTRANEFASADALFILKAAGRI